jgi:sarcosine oxidase subunit beta
MTDTADVVVIGAGVQGASLAFHLARRGARVVVVERSVAGAGATGRSSGLVRMYYDLLAEANLAWESFHWFRDWAERVGGECGFTKTGFLWIEPAELEDRVRENSAAHRGLGVDSSVLGPAEIAAIAPAIVVGDEVAAYEPESGYADPSMTATSFLAAARDRGARLLIGAEVTGIDVAGGRVTGVRTSRGDVDAPVVVDAAGAWARGVAALVGLDIPVDVWRHDTGYLGLPDSVERPIPVVIDNSRGMYFRPEGSDLLLVGLEDGSEMGGSPDRETVTANAGFRDAAAERLVQRVPGLVEATFRTAHAGQDGLTPDQRAMLGQMGPDGFYLDCGHSGTGFKTAPAIGLGMAELILDGATTTVDISPFDPNRFAEGRPLVGEHGEALIWR